MIVFLSFDGEQFERLDNSNYDHTYVFQLGIYQNQAFTTGCYYPSNCYFKTEIMNMTTMTWSVADDYPYSQ